MVFKVAAIAMAGAALAATATARPVGKGFSVPMGVQHHMPAHVSPKFMASRPWLGGAQTIGATPPEEPVGGDIWPVAIYWCFVEVGSPPVKFPVAIDSGSYTLDIPEKGCDGCVLKAPNAAYDASASSTSVNENRPFSNSYQTCDLKDPTAVCTIKGDWFTDEVHLGGAGPANVSFGAINYQTSNFDQFKNIDGVMGMAGPAGDTNTFTQLLAAGAVAEDLWAMCMHHGSTSNGTITFGGLDDSLYTGEMQWVPNSDVGQFYAVDTNTITIDFANGTTATVANTESSSILDTGTNVLLLPTSPFNSVVNIIRSTCGGSGAPLHGVCGPQKSILDGACYPYTAAQMAAFPEVKINLANDVTLTMKGKDYLLRHPTDDGLFCFGIRVSSTGGYQIIGDTTMQEYYLAFDRANHRVGWAPVDPKTCGSTK